MDDMSEQEIEEMSTAFISKVPLKRFGNSQEIANTALFVASEEVSYVNGVEIEVDRDLIQI